MRFALNRIRFAELVKESGFFRKNGYNDRGQRGFRAKFERFSWFVRSKQREHLAIVGAELLVGDVMLVIDDAASSEIERIKHGEFAQLVYSVEFVELVKFNQASCSTTATAPTAETA